ncbi:uncharacterized protein PV06_03370 [Exophiala oligosperma]|uniref:Uncharacterized protein n=1 Tax=Exophiala oligosperma TaxID=215243 RepID=A0A0D2AYP0_9EURO|nr:uncharacterized protein PV06_03370 [Exophiala oligosperma]KIW44936.1 hypothetical protein PV06_03370 [Exophiala oligosperma]
MYTSAFPPLISTEHFVSCPRFSNPHVRFDYPVQVLSQKNCFERFRRQLFQASTAQPLFFFGDFQHHTTILYNLYCIKKSLYYPAFQHRRELDSGRLGPQKMDEDVFAE